MGKAGKAAKAQLKRIAESLINSGLPCPPCGATDHLMCQRPDLENMVCCCTSFTESEEVKVDRVGAMKGAEDITDVQSTGRKRAAVLYPIAEGMVCEWSMLSRAGGGVVPIVGCLGNPATDRHHGPDKNTLNNTDGNVHRICSFCHNWWHAKNDEFYGKRPEGTEPFIPLDGHQWCTHDKDTLATTEEVLAAAIVPGRKQPKVRN